MIKLKPAKELMKLIDECTKPNEVALEDDLSATRKQRIKLQNQIINVLSQRRGDCYD